METPIQYDASAHAPHTITKFAEEGILLDSYDDIFSDFDPHPFRERLLSDDFIAGVKKVSRWENDQKVFLRLLLPDNVRNPKDEKIILKRMHSYFKIVYENMKRETRKTNLQGAGFIVIGAVLMLAASYISSLAAKQFYIHALLSLLEPAAWFMLWTGFDHLIYFSREKKHDLDFYSKIAKAEIKFQSYAA